MQTWLKNHFVKEFYTKQLQLKKPTRFIVARTLSYEKFPKVVDLKKEA